MTKEKLLSNLRDILQKLDCESDSPLTREKSLKHDDEIEVLIQHIKILVQDLLHDNQSMRNEMFDMQKLLEGRDDTYPPETFI